MNADLQRQLAQRGEVLEAVRLMLIGQLGVRREPGEIDPDTPLFGTGLGLDSVDAVEISVNLEVGFGIELTDDAPHILALRTVNTLIDLILEHREDRHGA